MNNPLTRTDPSGLAYFASGPLDLLFGIWFGTFSQNPIDDFFNTELSHEQLFFEDGKDPKNIGWGPDGNFTVDNVQNYHPKPGHYDDCIMRQAEKSIQWSGSSYWLIGKNCQTWADAVRKAYADLQSNGSAQSQCCE
jgi:hypothetical protein